MNKRDNKFLWPAVWTAIFVVTLVAAYCFIGVRNTFVIIDFDVTETCDTVDPEFAPESYVVYDNSVAGHLEQDTIVGNFTGLGIDTLYVKTVFDENAEDIEDRVKYYARSNNPDLPAIELFGCTSARPQLVYEGDVDSDGKDEWGYLHTWISSQWRQYRIYNYDSDRKKWRFLYYDTDDNGENLLSTPEYVRGSGVDLVEKGPHPGLIKINYGTCHPDYLILDTIVKPTYTPISKDAW